MQGGIDLLASLESHISIKHENVDDSVVDDLEDANGGRIGQ